MPRYEYTPREYAEMHFIYGEARGNARAAARLYRERYPNRDRHPDYRVFIRVHNALLEGRILGTGVGGASEGRPSQVNDEIDETSPTDGISRISEAQPQAESSRAVRESSYIEMAPPAEPSDNIPSDSSSSGVSPVKKAKVSKGKKKKLSITRQTSSSDSSKPAKEKAGRSKKDSKEDSEKEKGVKRSRSQRSLVDVERAKAKASEKAATEKAATEKATKEKASKEKPTSKTTKKPTSQSPKKPASPVEFSSPPSDMDVSNVTVRRSTRGPQSGSSSDSNGSAPIKPVSSRTTRSSAGSRRSSAGSSRSALDDSDDTMLHTIVYEQEFVQSVLNDSNELAETRRDSKANVTIPETPDASEESEPEPEIPKKGKRNAKKK